MLTRLRNTLAEYPYQFKLMGAGLLISSTGTSLIWPFLMIYVSEKLHLSLSVTTILITINAFTGLLSSFVAGLVADRIGRKLVMVISLSVTGLGYLLMSQANAYWQFAALMVLMGASNPLYQVGADAMLADLIPPEGRTNAYAIIRMLNNAGIAIGPAVGGFLASRSYTYTFLGAASGMMLYSLLLVLRARETLPAAHEQKKEVKEAMGGFERVFHDRPFINFSLLVGMGLIAPAMCWTLLAVYTKQNYGLPEKMYGWLPTTNALMCVFVQFFVTRFFRKYHSLTVAIIGMFIYAIGVGSYALMHSFWGFWLGMVIMTFGELTTLPTVSKYIADLAPTDARGRYMSFYWFAWGVARGLSPIIGGLLNDHIAPRAIWVGGLVVGLASSLGLLIYRSSRKRVPEALAVSND